MGIEKGGMVLLKRNAREPLDPKFDGPYEVLETKWPDLKLNIGTKRKWHHISRCKPYLYSTTVLTWQNIGASGNEREDIARDIAHDVNGEVTEPEQNIVAQNVITPIEGAETRTENATDARRYPKKERKPRQFFGEMIPWSEVDKKRKVETSRKSTMGKKKDEV